MVSRQRAPLFLVLGLVAAAGAPSCSAADSASGGSQGAGGTTFAGSSAGSTGGGGAAASSSSSFDPTGPSGTGGSILAGGGGSGPFHDFPHDPIVDPSAPANAASLFTAAPGDGAGGPCVFEPEADTLYPGNWLRPRFRFNAMADQNLFELRLHTTEEVDDLVVYTAGTSWTMDKTLWQALVANGAHAPITMTIRGAHFDGTSLTSGPATGSSFSFSIAPADAAGAIVYWTTTGGSALKGFTAGDETVAPTLAPGQVKMKTVGGADVGCIGCHTSTPDGKFAGFSAQGPWGNALASVEAATVGDQPSFLGAGALATLDQYGDLGIQSYSKGHWATGDHVMVTPFGAGHDSQLAWIDLEAATAGMGSSYGYLTRNGDARGAGAPSWSHAGDSIVYVSTDAEYTGRLDQGDADLYAVPYNARQGGDAKPIAGASDPSLEEYYPAFSPDDAFLAFNAIPSGTNMYNQPLAEVFVLPSAGGTKTRLAANDPAACTGRASPGITNSWPKWAPQAATIDGRTYYWLIFSSTRGPLQNPQLYITGVVVSGGSIETHGALYLWNQPETENNHTPAWDFFQIPTPPPQ